MEFNIISMLRFEFDQLIDEHLTDKQAIVLELIREHPQITTSEIATRLHVTASAVSQILNGLEKKDMVTRSINKQNRRETHLALTAKAVQYFRKIESVELAIAQKYYAKMEHEELLQLRNLLKKFERIIKEEQAATTE